MEKKHEIDEYFSKKVIGKEKKEEKDEEEETSEEWFVDDGPLKDGVKEIFVRPGKREDEEVVTRAS